jgi:hypothetical protein
MEELLSEERQRLRSFNHNWPQDVLQATKKFKEEMPSPVRSYRHVIDVQEKTGDYVLDASRYEAAHTVAQDRQK